MCQESEGQSIMNAGEYDIRRTPVEWIQQIDDLDKEAMVFLIAEGLSGSNLVKKDGEEGESVKARAQIIDYALEKYLTLVDGSVDTLLMKVRKVVREESKKHPSESRDLLALQLGSIDLILRRGNLGEIQSLHIFLNAFRDFVPQDLLHIKLKKIHNVLVALDDTMVIRVVSQQAVSGVIDTDK